MATQRTKKTQNEMKNRKRRGKKYGVMKTLGMLILLSAGTCFFIWLYALHNQNSGDTVTKNTHRPAVSSRVGSKTGAGNIGASSQHVQSQPAPKTPADTQKIEKPLPSQVDPHLLEELLKMDNSSDTAAVPQKKSPATSKTDTAQTVKTPEPTTMDLRDLEARLIAKKHIFSDNVTNPQRKGTANFCYKGGDLYLIAEYRSELLLTILTGTIHLLGKNTFRVDGSLRRLTVDSGKEEQIKGSFMFKANAKAKAWVNNDTKTKVWF